MNEIIETELVYEEEPKPDTPEQHAQWGQIEKLVTIVLVSAAAFIALDWIFTEKE